MSHKSYFDDQLNKVLREYKLTGKDFGLEKRDHNAVRKAHKMQPSTGGHVNVKLPLDDEAAELPDVVDDDDDEDYD